ncbi:MAG: hypothetical protein U0797_26500 [Gemmataceae bacterium]
MRLLRIVGLVLKGTKAGRRYHRAAADALSVARCPRCGGELVARIARGRPGFWCRCPVRRALAIGA